MGLNTELRIPDLWYDFYTRLLPGTTFVVCLRRFVLGEKTKIARLELWGTLSVGYFCGLLVAPLGSRLTGWILWLFDKKGDVEESKILLGRDSNEAMILNKMKGECCFFVHLLVLCVVFLILYHVNELSKEPQDIPSVVRVSAGLPDFCVLASFEVAHRRVKRGKFPREALKRLSTGGTPPPTSSKCSASEEKKL